MKILVFSDSHNRCEKMCALITQFMSKNGTLDYIIHLGDLVRDAEYLIKRFPEVPVLYVYGNSDYSYKKSDLEKEFEIGGKKFFILHGHTYNAYSLDTLKSLAEQKKPDVILHGHTHVPREEYYAETKTHIICPGSITSDRSGAGRSYCAIDITGDSMGIKVILVN